MDSPSSPSPPLSKQLPQALSLSPLIHPPQIHLETHKFVDYITLIKNYEDMNSAEEREADDMKMKLFASATEDELFVSQILLDLENLIPLPRFIWGCRKRRSCPVAATTAPPSVQIAEEEIEVRRPLPEAEKEDAAAAAANTTISSPATPFSFSPSESDGKSKRPSKKTSKKRSRAEFIDMIEGLTEHRDLLIVKVENVREQFNKLKIQNSNLKEMKREAPKTCQRRDEAQREMGRFLNLGIDFIQHDETIMLPHHQPFIADPTVHKLHHPFGPIEVYPPKYNGLESVNLVAPSVGIPDLNLTAEDAFGVDLSQPLDVDRDIADKRAKFAEARRMRKGILKIKLGALVE